MKWLGLAIAGMLICQAVGGLAIAIGQAHRPYASARRLRPASELRLPLQ